MDAVAEAQADALTGPLSDAERVALDAWWRATDDLSVGQICRMGDPLLREPLLPEHIKPDLVVATVIGAGPVTGPASRLEEPEA